MPIMAVAPGGSSPPWWGVPLVAGMFTLIGVIASQASSFLLERIKGRRERESRWIAERMEKCSRYLALCELYYSETFGEPSGQTVNRGDLLRARGEVEFVAPASVIAKAIQLFQKVTDLREARLKSSDMMDWHDEAVIFRVTAMEYTDSVRAEFGLPPVLPLIIPDGYKKSPDRSEVGED